MCLLMDEIISVKHEKGSHFIKVLTFMTIYDL